MRGNPMSDETTTKVDEQTPAQKEETSQTPAKEEEKEETFTKSELTRMLKKQAAELTAKYKPLEEKAKKLDEIETSKKSEEEKATARLKALEDKIAEKDKILAERELRDLKRAKIEQAIADGKMELPKGKTVESLVKRCLGLTAEEIDSDIEDLIGFFPKPETKPEPKGLGTATKTGEPATKKSLKEQLGDVSAKLSDPKTTYKERTALIDQSLQLNRRISKGET
jgi:hypothetical protein